MNDTILAQEHAREASNKANELVKKMGRLLPELTNGFCSKNCDIVFDQLQAAYTSALMAAIELQKSMQLLTEWEPTSQAIHSAVTTASGIQNTVEFDPETRTLSCKILAAPILKKRGAAKLFLDVIGSELSRNIEKTLPENFEKFRAAYVIFVSNIEKDSTKKQAYFDNDNIAIKGILDSILPYTCFDDAAKFCQNIYLYHETTGNFSEIFVVPEGQLSTWKSKHPELKFCQEFTP